MNGTQALKRGMIALAAALVLISSTAAAYNDTIEKSFSVRPGGVLTLDSDVGAIDIRTWDRNEVAVRIERDIHNDVDEVLDRMHIEMDSNGRDVDIVLDFEGGFGGIGGFISFLFGHRSPEIQFELTVPVRYDVDVSTAGGSIRISDLTGSVHCKTSGGKIELDTIAGPVVARTSGGSITLHRTSGTADLHTSGGRITIGEAGGDVTAKTSGGGISIERASGTVYARTSGGGIEVNECTGSIDASTSGGGVKAYISRQPGGPCRLSTSGGGVTVYVDPDSRFSIDAKTSGGSVNANGLTVQLLEKGRSNLVANMNGGGPELHLRSSGGNINIHTR